MAWVRIDEGFTEHPKLVRAGPLAMAMQVAGLCYCNRYLTDGFIPEAKVPTLLNLQGLADWQDVVATLVREELWTRVDGGYQIHDYLHYQPSRAQVLAEREAARQRMARRSRRPDVPEEEEMFARNSGEVRENFSFPDPVPVSIEEREGEAAHAQQPTQNLPDWRRWYERRFASFPPERWRLEIDEKVDKGMSHELVIAALEAAIEAKAEHPLSWANSKLAAWFARGIRSPADLERDKQQGVKDRGSTRAETRKRDYRSGKYARLFGPGQDPGDGAGPDGGRGPPLRA